MRDQIDRAANCTELRTAWREAIGEVAGEPSEVLGAIHDRVAERAQDLAGEALARGAEAEAELCQQVVDSASL